MHQTMTNKAAADVLFNVATILEMTEDNPYRVRAYRRAAQMLISQPRLTRNQLTPAGELDLPGLGASLRLKLGELVRTGQLRFFVELCADFPEGVRAMLDVEGVGPKTAWRLNDELGIRTVGDLIVAAETGQIRALYGFGPVREANLLRAALEALPEQADDHHVLREPIPFRLSVEDEQAA